MEKFLLGHEVQWSLLMRLVQIGRLPHALVFHGPNGVGKRQLAQQLAQVLLCEQEQNEACGVCSSCVWFQAGSHPDYEEVEPQGNSLKISQIRQVQQQAALSSRNSQGRVFVLNDAHTMTAEAQNSLLKVLEEPPDNVYFILVAAEPQKLLTTVLSRCRPIRFDRIPEEQVIAWLRQQGAETQTADLAARLAEGCPGQALGYLEPGGLSLWQKVVQFAQELPEAQRPLEFAEIAEKLDPLQRMEWLRFMRLYYRDLLLAGQVSLAALKRLAVQTNLCESLQLEAVKYPQLAQAALAQLDQVEQNLKANGNVRLTIEAWTLAVLAQL